ncbi:MAG: hypothetical protein RKO68_08785 [Candidatus Accumulibacter sp.]|nr:hypothetical protein [Accumulibacter sp.]
MSEQKLAELIREIQPGTFSKQAHGDGYRVVLDKNGNTSPYERGAFDFLRGWRRDERQYYVRKLATPLEITGWRFRWSEGTSAIALDFESSFQLQANGLEEAMDLVSKLAKADSPTETLRALISRHLYAELNRMLQLCQSAADDNPSRNLLAAFRTSSLGSGKSESLNKAVSEAVHHALGGAMFRIGFRVLNLPPMQVSIRQEDMFTLGDSDRERKVTTTALLILDNYQNFRESGLDDENAVRSAISVSIRQAVKRHLFAQRYYEVVRSFATHQDSIKIQMEKQIAKDAAKIGYRLNMFQAFPDIAALALITGRRLDLRPEEHKYKPKNSEGYVQMNIAINVTAQAFERLDRLIHPDTKDVDDPIRRHVEQICRDQIQRIDSTQFNLQFDKIVKPQITESIIQGLKLYDIDAEVIYVLQHPTEEAARYAAICGQPRNFEVVIPSQADAGDADEVQITGRVEVTGMTENGWEQFVRKNYGYRSDTHISWQQMRQLAAEVGIDASGEPVSNEQRQSLAIEIELAAIRREVTSAIRGALVTESGLAALTRTESGLEKIHAKIRNAAQTAIKDAFGLAIALYGLDRGNTLTEIAFQTRRKETLGLVQDRAALQREAEINRFKRLEEGRLEGISQDFRTRRLLQQETTEDVDADMRRIDERLQAAQLPSDGKPDVSYDAGMEILAAAKKPLQDKRVERLLTDESAEEEKRLPR